MNAVEIKKDIYWVGVKDWNLVEFHGYSTPHGSTYNSYLIMDDNITLVDGVKHYLSHENIARIQSLTDFSKIKYIVVNHVEMDHSGNIPELMKLAPQATIVTNSAGKHSKIKFTAGHESGLKLSRYLLWCIYDYLYGDDR